MLELPAKEESLGSMTVIPRSLVTNGDERDDDPPPIVLPTMPLALLSLLACEFVAASKDPNKPPASSDVLLSEEVVEAVVAPRILEAA